MAPKNRIIIDTDPGVDDVLAMLLAFAAKAEDLEVLLVSLTFGNVDVRNCLRNVVAIFHILEKELKWREKNGNPVGFEGITKFKPIVAIGAEEPLQDRIESADYFHGVDGLAGTHTTHPHFSPEESWKRLFEEPPPDSFLTETAKEEVDLEEPAKTFIPSLIPAHKEILRLLRENEPDTITLISIGPLTNFALAATEDPETFLRCKEVVTMGGTVDGIGNVTPVAEFNVYADPYAAATVYALTSPIPSSTMPVPTEGERSFHLPPYPPRLSKQLKLTLMSLDITEFHILSRGAFSAYASELAKQGSPLAQWATAFMDPMFDKMERLHIGHEGEGAALALHDPLCVWYVLTRDDQRWKPSARSPEDIRVETAGQWTRGMTVGDKRPRKRRNSDGEVPHDRGNWLGNRSGNRIYRMLESPGRDAAAPYLLDAIFRND
ncbi:DNA glycosylase [Capronia epimyces CBS 606.96]|uniref:DNA glycosylase n=1 Tax=Capronia epimyces CBS 606.96 TaxID=1182542 RepID=W9XLB4_9EURO|nr:DNA glycosylase [Capronia epimyces CBS 606.96]EXJ77761.1 DNA glycosylase [Capronia epimyces CBS 606.96]